MGKHRSRGSILLIAALSSVGAWRLTKPPERPIPVATLNSLQIAERNYLADPHWRRIIGYTTPQVLAERRWYERWDEAFAPCMAVYEVTRIEGFDYETSEAVRRTFDGPFRELADRQVGGRLPRLTPPQPRALEAAAAKDEGPWLWTDPVVARRLGLDQTITDRVRSKWNALFAYYLSTYRAEGELSREAAPYWWRRLECDLPVQRTGRYRAKVESELFALLSPSQRGRWDAMLRG